MPTYTIAEIAKLLKTYPDQLRYYVKRFESERGGLIATNDGKRRYDQKSVIKLFDFIRECLAEKVNLWRRTKVVGRELTGNSKSRETLAALN